MKNLNRLVLGALLLVGFGSANAQDENNPWNITVGTNAIDVFPVNGDSPQGDYFQEFFNVEDHWSILPSLSTLSVARHIKNNFSLEAKASINQITKWGQIDGVTESVKVNELDYYALDANVRYHFGKVIGAKFIDPSIGIGGGYTYIEEGPYNTVSDTNGTSNLIGSGTVNGSVGIKFNFTDNIGLAIESKYKHSFADYLTSHMQHSLGLSIGFGGADADADGVYDKDDACPDVAGLKEFNGCPDTDGDGIEDSKDDCPEVAGLAEFNGCADTDGDGVSDNKDNCPTVAGLIALAGCPDADADGVADVDDKCPSEAGPVANNGCPYLDTDKDGVLDKDDKCPTVVGIVANNGCPEYTYPDQLIIEKFNNYAKTIQFNSGKSSFRKVSYPILKSITAILKEYPDAKFSIEGHTDSVGSSNSNLKLSKSRANSVMNYFINNGIKSSRLTANGFGESNPIDSNKTRAGRKNNRRVHIKLIK